MEVKLNSEHGIDTLGRIAAGLAEQDPDWLAQRRARAFDSFRASGFPTLKHEDWKYTDVRPLVNREYRLHSPAGADIDEGVVVPAPVEGLDACRLVVVNGRFSHPLSDLGALPEGVSVLPMKDAIASHEADVQARLGLALPSEGHGFSALNDAFVNDGVFLRVAAGVRVARPIELVFVVSGGDAAPLVQPRNLVVVGEGAEVELVERYVCSHDAPYLDNTVTEVFLEPSSRLGLCRIQQEGARAGHVGGLFVRQRSASRCEVHTVSLEGMLIRNDLRVFLDEPRAECRLYGLSLGGGRQHIDNHTHVDHNAESCVSRELYKSVLDGRARSVFHGRIVVKPGAQHTDSEQRNQTLLMSRDAEVDTKPQLEIYADDVKCSHGATVGQLDEDSVFYLRSRGIDEADARALLTVAFADSAVADIGSDALRAFIDRHIRVKLGAKT